MARLGLCLDGRRDLIALLLLAPLLGLTWVAWLLRRLRAEPSCAEVAPGLFLGRLAAPRELPPSVRVVVDLTCELSEPSWIRTHLTYHCLPTLDGEAPEPRLFAALARQLAATTEPLFIHCAAGHGRSATVVAAVLLARGQVRTVEQAEASLKALRPGVVFSAPQRELLDAWWSDRPRWS